MLCGLGEGPRARRRDASAERLRFGCQFFLEAAARARAIQLRLRAAMGVHRRRNNGGAMLGSLFWLPYRRATRENDRGQPRSLISAAVGAWQVPQGIRGCICVIIRQLFRGPRAQTQCESLPPLADSSLRLSFD